MDTFSIPEYIVNDDKTTYGDLRHVSQRMAAHVKYLVNDRNAGRQIYGWVTVYKRDGERYVPIFTRDQLINVPGSAYKEVKDSVMQLIKNA